MQNRTISIDGTGQVSINGRVAVNIKQSFWKWWKKMHAAGRIQKIYDNYVPCSGNNSVVIWRLNH